MHIILALAGVLGAIGYWWFVAKRAGGAVLEITDAVGRVRGAVRRRRFARRAEASRIDAIDDVRLAAMVMAVAVATEDTGRLSPGQEAKLTQLAIDTLGLSDPTEFAVFAKWAVAERVEPGDLALRLSRLWNRQLTMEERADLVALVAAVAAADGPLTAGQTLAMQQLRGSLALGSAPA